MYQVLSTHPIAVNIQSRDSIAKALTQYTELVNSGEAFRHTYCKYIFEFSTPYDWSQYSNKALISSLLHSSYLIDEVKDNLNEALSSETCLFLIALEDKTLLPQLVELAKAMRERGRLVNNWYHLFISEEQFFGLHSLYALSYCYPEYGYLLTGFIAAKDKYTSDTVLNLVNAYAQHHGITSDTIKAWCYCDHPSVRNTMFIQDPDFDASELHKEYDDEDEENDEQQAELAEDSCQHDSAPISPLYHYFATNQAAFIEFQALLTQRFIDQAYLPFEEYLDPYDTWGQDIEPVKLATQPVDYFYASLLAHDIKDYSGIERDFDYDYLTAKTRDVAQKHAQAIEADLGKPLSESVDPWAEQRAKISYYSIYTARFEWTEFVSRNISNGAALWDYVDKGSYESVLETAPNVNFHQVCKETHSLCELKDTDSCSASEFNDKLYDLVIDFVEDELDRVQIEDKDSARVLRFFDLLFHLSGGKALKDDIKTLIVDTYPIIDAAGFDKRYRKSIDSKQDLSELHSVTAMLSEPNFETLTHAYSIICQYRNAALNWYQGLAQLRAEKQMLISAYIVAMETANPEKHDDLYRACLDYVETQVVEQVIDEMKDKISTNYLKGEAEKICNQRWQELVDFIHGKNRLTAKQAESNMLMFYHPESETHWDRKLKFEGAFRFDHDHYLLATIYLIIELPLSIQSQLKRLLECITFIEPISIIESLYDFYIPSLDEDEDESTPRLNEESEAILLSHLARLNIDKLNYYIWLMDRSYFEKRWHQMLELYGQQEHSEPTQLLDQALIHSEQRDRVRFLQHLEELRGKSRRLARAKLEQECLWALENWLARSLPQPEQRLYDSLNDTQQLGYSAEGHYLLGEDNYMQVHKLISKLAKEIPLDAALSQLLVKQPYLHHECFMLQKQGDDYKLLTKPWLIKSINNFAHLAFKDYPSIYVIDDTVSSDAIEAMRQALDNNLHQQQVAKVMAYIRGEVTYKQIVDIVQGVEFKELDYLPENSESYSVEDLLEHLSVGKHNRVANLLEPRDPTLLERVFSLFGRD